LFRSKAGPSDGLSTEQFPVSAYGGSSKNLKDLKDLNGGQARVPLGVHTWRPCWYGGASLIRKHLPLGPYSRAMSRALRWA